MSRRQTLGRWLSTSDAALSWAERIAKLIVLGIASGVLGSAAGIVIGFFTGNPLSGLVIGVVVGMVILVGFAVQVVRVAVAGAPAPSVTEESSSQFREALRSDDAAPEQLDESEALKRFYAQPLQKVSGAAFVDERIPMDGMHYDHCTFERCTFVYRGEKPFGLSHFEVRGNDNTLEAHSPGLQAFSRLLVALKYINPHIEVDKSLQPTQDVAVGYRLVKATDGNQPSAEELKVELERLREESGQLRVTADGYVAAYNRVQEAHQNRVALIIALRELWEEGERLLQYEHHRWDIEDWQNRTSKLIEMALGIEERRRFLKPNPEYAKWSKTVDDSDSEEQIYMKCLLDRLKDLVKRANSVAPHTELNSNFAIREYRKWLETR
jgi:hypothetical protein